MRTSIYLAVAFAILLISLSDAAVYKRHSGDGTPSGSGLTKPGSSGMKTRSNMLQRRGDSGSGEIGDIVQGTDNAVENAGGNVLGGLDDDVLRDGGAGCGAGVL